MDFLWVVRTGLEMGLLLALSWPLAVALRALAARGLWAPARTWLAVAQALVVAALLLPIGGRLLLRDRAAGWAPVQVWEECAGGGESAARITLDAAPGSPSPSPHSGSRPLGQWIALIAAAAAAGAAFRGARLVSALSRLRRQLESLHVLRRLGLVRIVASHAASTAYSARVGGRAWVVIPSSSLTSVSCRRLTIAHEIQHHRHRDTARAVAFQALAAFFWWNPALGPLGRALAALEELACDEALVARRSIDRASYAACLLEAAGRISPSETMPAHVASMAGHARGLLKRRIEMICKLKGKHARSVTIAVVAVVFGILGAGSLMARGAVVDRRISRAEAQALARSKAGALPVRIDDRLLAELNRLTGSPGTRAFVREGLSRMTAHRPSIEKALAEKGLPLELLAVPLVESGFQNMEENSKLPSLAPGQRGAGIWMFIPETARHYGLRVDGVNDDRLDPALETRAAVAMLSELHARYGDWPLALAAYNQGPHAVDAAIAAVGSRDAAALARAGRLNGYTSTVLAAVLVLRNPKLVE